MRHEEDDQLRNDYKGQSQDPGLQIVVADVDVVAVADAANVVAVVVVVDDDADADVYDDDDVVYDDDDDDDDDDAHDHDDDERAENDWPLQGTNRKPHSNKEGRHNKGRHW